MGGKYLLPLHMECKRVKCQCDEFSSQFCKYKQAAKPKKVKAKPKAKQVVVAKAKPKAKKVIVVKDKHPAQKVVVVKSR